MMKNLTLRLAVLLVTLGYCSLAHSKAVFPDAGTTYLKDIPRFDISTFTHIAQGIHKDSVRTLIGNPHFNEFITNEWNYIVKINSPSTKGYIECQLQLHFNQNNLLSHYYWSSSECSDLVNRHSL